MCFTIYISSAETPVFSDCTAAALDGIRASSSCLFIRFRFRALLYTRQSTHSLIGTLCVYTLATAQFRALPALSHMREPTQILYTFIELLVYYILNIYGIIIRYAKSQLDLALLSLHFFIRNCRLLL